MNGPTGTETNTELLSNILELCETHLDEGEYLRASNLLKSVHEKKPDPETKIVNFTRPIKIVKVDGLGNDENEDIIKIKGVILKKRPYFSNYSVKKIFVCFSGDDDEENEFNKEVSFEKCTRILRHYMKTNLFIDVCVSDNHDTFLDCKYYSLRDYKNFYVRSQISMSVNDDDPDDCDFCSDWLYDKYLGYIIDSIKENLQIIFDDDE
jgi:hypothetical protein